GPGRRGALPGGARADGAGPGADVPDRVPSSSRRAPLRGAVARAVGCRRGAHARRGTLEVAAPRFFSARLGLFPFLGGRSPGTPGSGRAARGACPNHPPVNFHRRLTVKSVVNLLVCSAAAAALLAGLAALQPSSLAAVALDLGALPGAEQQTDRDRLKLEDALEVAGRRTDAMEQMTRELIDGRL